MIVKSASCIMSDILTRVRASLLCPLRCLSRTGTSAGFSYKTVLFYGAGPNAATMVWGDALLRRYGKAHDGPRNDFTNTHLIYNTGENLGRGRDRVY